MKINKDKMIDTQGRPLTQSLFLEIGYNTDYAIYTLKSQDHAFKGKQYISLKRLYLEMSDPIEYDFANEYLIDYPHWERLCENKIIAKHVKQWRKELELKLRSEGVATLIELAPDSYQAAKWLADKGWETKRAGRPSKKEQQMEDELASRIESDYSADIVRLTR